MNTSPRPDYRLHAAALAFYALLAFLILHPLLFKTGTHVAGFDYFNYHWNFWWIRFASSTPGLSVYETNFTMFPYTTNLGYHALTAFWYPVWAVLEPVIGTLAAMNVIIFVACTLNGYLLFVLLRREGASPALALIGGLFLQAAPTLRYFYYNTHINLMDWFWLPALIMIWGEIARVIDLKKWLRAAVIAPGFGVALWGLFLTDLQFPLFAAFLVVPYGLVTLWRSKNRVALIAAGAVALGVTGALLWFAGPIPHILEFEGTLAPGTVEDRPGIPPIGFLRMSDQWWEWSAPSVGLAITTLVLIAIVAALRTRATRSNWKMWGWFLLMLPPLIFALGPTLHIGDLAIPLPFRVLHAQTDGMFRMPWRLMPIAIIAGMAFAVLALTPVLRRFNRAGIGMAVSALILLFVADVRFFESAPLTPVPPEYSFYETIRNEPYDEVIIEIPTGTASGEVIIGDPRATQLQWYTLVHQKRIVNGFISRAPLENFFYLETNDPMLSWLGQRQFFQYESVAAQMQERIADWNIGYFVIHRDLIEPNQAAIQDIIGNFNWAFADLVCVYTVEGDAVVYRTRQHPDGCPPDTPPQDDSGAYVIDIGAADDVRYLSLGWHYAEEVGGLTLRWAGDQPGAAVYVDLPPQAYTVEVTTQAYFEPRQLTLRINGAPVGETVEVQPGSLQTVTFNVPAEAIGSGEHIEVGFIADDWRVPAEVEGSGDTRKLSIAVDTIRLIPQ